jgi:hypothetical protein
MILAGVSAHAATDKKAHDSITAKRPCMVLIILMASDLFIITCLLF